ncbi:hypothetical protein [Pseudonocardia endophytica]|uniref:hypothetical protein n=1 Tax=Pseudonocardia endophytica TaxID=401976 RepID=UPI00104C1AB9|nr:hypothetical protein [Pseudonocardia endophytica]
MPSVTLGARPGRDELDPVLADAPSRVIVRGTDGDLAAVLVRLLRKELLGAVEVAFVPSGRSPAARAWGLPSRPADAGRLALAGRATPVPLVRDDAGGVLAGRGEIRDLHGEAYCDATRVLNGTVHRLRVEAGPDGVSVLGDRGVHAATGRALQIGFTGARVTHDGVEHPREVTRWAWYRHTEPWLLVRP